MSTTTFCSLERLTNERPSFPPRRPVSEGDGGRDREDKDGTSCPRYNGCVVLGSQLNQTEGVNDPGVYGSGLLQHVSEGVSD